MSETASEAKPSTAAFTDTLRRIRESIDGLSEAQLIWKPAPDKWSVKEVVAHLVDSSIVHSVRVRKIVTEPHPVLPVYDQDAWVAGARSNEAAIADILQTYEVILTYNAMFYGRITDADWEKVGDTNGKQVTVAELFQGFIRHVGIHLAQIDRTKAALPSGLV
ncbi:MAG: DinB family protein [Paenibacillaceae bacterium]|nr:DinB family protein [Paenibacillaceae bacterium]